MWTKNCIQLIRNGAECQAQELGLAVVSVFSPVDASTRCLTYRRCRRRVTAPGRGSAAHSQLQPHPTLRWPTAGATAGWTRIEITGDKRREQGWVESLKVYANKGEQMVEGWKPAQGGRSSSGGNTSRSGSCYLGKCMLWRDLMSCLNGSKSKDFSKSSPLSLPQDPGRDQCKDHPNTKHASRDRGTLHLLAAVYCSSVCCSANPDRRLSLALTAEAPSCTTRYICTHAFACVNTSAEK